MSDAVDRPESLAERSARRAPRRSPEPRPRRAALPTSSRQWARRRHGPPVAAGPAHRDRVRRCSPSTPRPDYEAMLLSPVAPIGTNSAVAPTSQDRTLTTIRGSEVVSDPTNVLALECARRLRAAPREPRSALHRAPGSPDAAGAARRRAHAATSACSRSPTPDRVWPTTASRWMPSSAQLGAYRRLLDTPRTRRGLAWDRADRDSAQRRPAPLRSRTASRSRSMPTQPDARGPAASRSNRRTTTGSASGFGVHARTVSLREWIDLGVFDWVAQLTSNRRQRFVASAIGLQLLPLLRPGALER